MVRMSESARKMSKSARIPACLLLCVLPMAAQAGDVAQPRVWSGDELAAGVTFVPDVEGPFDLYAWDATRHAWRISRNNASVLLERDTNGNDASPRWVRIGSLPLAARESCTIKPKPPGDPSEDNSPPAPVPPLLVILREESPENKLSAILDVARGRLDDAAPTDDARRETVRTNQQGAEFRPPDSAQAWRDRAQNLREQMRVCLGLWPELPRVPPNARIYGKLERDGYTIERVVLQTLPGFFVAGNLYRPAGTKPDAGPAPGILCPHGHWEDGRLNVEVQHRCIRWAKLGCVAFMYDMVGYNDNKDFGHAFLDDALIRWGFSLATLQTWNSLRVVDWIRTLPDVDPARIGCTGESGGGTQTFLLAALDSRIAAAAPVVMVSEGFQGGCACENAAGLRHGTDNVEFAALAAPRPMKLIGATGDWTSHTTSHILPVLRNVYALVGDPARVEAETFTFPHNYNQTSRNAVYPFLARWLMGVDDPAITNEGDQTPEPPENLLAFGAEHPAPPHMKSREALKADLIARRSAALENFAPDDSPVLWENARETLLRALRIRVGLENPSANQLNAVELRRADRDGVRIIHTRVRRGESGEQVAAVRLVPQNPGGSVTVMSHPRGKLGLIDDDGGFSPLVRALLERGHTVVGYDPLFVGESLDSSAPRARRPATAHFLTYNKSLAADRMQDLATAVAWASYMPQTRRVNLIGVGHAGPLALLALPALDGVHRAYIDMTSPDYRSDSADVPAGLDLPGVAQFGGLEAAATLRAPHPLWLVWRGARPVNEWPRRAYRLAAAEEVLLWAEDDDAPGPPPQAVAAWLDGASHANR